MMSRLKWRRFNVKYIITNPEIANMLEELLNRIRYLERPWYWRLFHSYKGLRKW
jgi:hypothetical protein